MFQAPINLCFFIFQGEKTEKNNFNIMRIKLTFSNSSIQAGKRKKICFFVNKEDCHVVSDLAYQIQRRFLSSSGIVSLFLDDFYIPPTENINIIQENDILIVKLVQFFSQ